MESGPRRRRWRSRLFAMQFQARAALATLGANFAGAIATFVYLQFLAPEAAAPQTEFEEELILSLTVFGFYMAGTVVVGAIVLSKMGTPMRRWLAEDRPPTEDEQRLTLQLPGRYTIASGWLWFGAAILFGALNLTFDEAVAEAGRVFTGIIFGGLATCGFTFLAVERVLRPVVVLALAGGKRLQTTRGLRIWDRIVLAWALGSGIPLLGIAIAPLSNNSISGRLAIPVVSLALMGLGAGFWMTKGTARAIAEPLGRVRTALEEIRDGNLDVSVPVDDGGDVGMVEAGVNQMVVATKERARLEDLFGRHVGADVARHALEQGVTFEGEEREVTALFVDVIGSTALATRLPPAEVVDILNAFFGCVVIAVSEEGGWVNKFEGDGALCVFGAPVAQPDHAARALRAARRMRELISEESERHPGLEAGIGVSSGTVVAGNVGAEDRYEYTVIGDPVNEASRLSEHAKTTTGHVLASGRTIAAARAEAESWAEVGKVVLRGRTDLTELWEPESAPEGEVTADEASAIRPVPL